jgi:hypothetical protein
LTLPLATKFQALLLLLFTRQFATESKGKKRLEDWRRYSMSTMKSRKKQQPETRRFHWRKEKIRSSEQRFQPLTSSK